VYLAENGEEPKQKKGEDKKAFDARKKAWDAKCAADKKAADKKAMDAKKAADARKAKDETKEEEKEREEREAEDARKAMDAAIEEGVTKGVAKALAADSANRKAIRDAERAVRPFVGDIAIACDSAPQVYQTALGILGVKTKATDLDALKTMLDLAPKPGQREHRNPLALDAAAAKSTTDLFPGLARLMN
jgi:hypothetical protein